MTSFPEAREWLARHPDIDEVFRRMFDVDSGTGCWFMASPSMGGDEIWSSSGPTIATARSSSSVLRDLREQGLLRVGRQGRDGPQYELPSKAREFEEWRRGLPSPVEQVEQTVLRLVDDAGFVDRHPHAAKHLRAAFELLAAAPLDVPDTTITGDHLRKALIDVVGLAVGLDTSDEDLERVFKPVRRSAAERADLATVRLVDLCRAVFSLAHAVEHVRDEVTAGRDPADAEVLRRAAFLTALCCYELDRVPLLPLDSSIADE